MITEKDYRLFCMALVQRYVAREKADQSQDVFRMFFTSKGMRLANVFKGLTEEEKERLRLEIMAIHDRTIEVFKSIPSKLMLVTRYLLVCLMSVHSSFPYFELTIKKERLMCCDHVLKWEWKSCMVSCWSLYFYGCLFTKYICFLCGVEFYLLAFVIIVKLSKKKSLFVSKLFMLFAAYRLKIFSHIIRFNSIADTSLICNFLWLSSRNQALVGTLTMAFIKLLKYVQETH